MRFLLGSGSWGAIVPHAPMLLPSVSPAFRNKPLVQSLAHVRERSADVAILVSSHGQRSGVYSRTSGSLDRMAVPGVRAESSVEPELIGELAFEWGEPRLDAPWDHGIVVPLALDAVPAGVPVIGVALEEATGPGKSFSGGLGRAAAGLAAAIASFAHRRNVAVIASGHCSAGLTDRAPLSLRQGADSLDARVLEAIGSDAGGLLQIDESSWAHGEPCGRGPLLVLAHLFQNHSGTVHEYDASQGVGYLVATVDAQ